MEKKIKNSFLGCRERFNVSKRSELRSGSVVNLRVIDVLVVNVILHVILDMYEWIAIGLLLIKT